MLGDFAGRTPHSCLGRGFCRGFGEILTENPRSSLGLAMVDEGAVQGAEIRGRNRAAILRLLQAAPSARAAISAATGLSAPTVTRVVATLLQEGVVRERVASPAARAGRPAAQVELIPGAGAVVGMTLGMGLARLVVCDLIGQVERRAVIRFDADDAEEALREIGAKTRRLLAAMGDQRARVLGVGVGAPGPVDAAGRTILLGVHHGWRDVPAADILEAAVQVPVTVDHLVRAMAFAEAHHGCGREDRNLAFVYVQLGVGAGLVLDRQPYHSGTQGTTEIGHIQVVADGKPCVCGNTGCLETVVSSTVLQEAAQALRDGDPGGVVAQQLGAGMPAVAALDAAAAAGDDAADDVLRAAGATLGQAVVTLVNLFNPTLVVLGGVASDSEILAECVRDQIRRHAFPLIRDSVRVEMTTFGALVGPIGAAAVALERFFYRVPASRQLGKGVAGCRSS